MKGLLIAVLETFGYPVYLQGSLLPEQHYPPAFFTYWNNSSEDRAHYDNHPIDFVWDFDVNFYANDPTLVNTKLEQAIDKLKKSGFIISGKGYDLASDEITHTGRGVNALIIQRNEVNEDAE